MSAVDRALVEKLSKLSRLDFNTEQQTVLQKELGNILDFISQLKNVNTDGVEPMASVVAGMATREREDKVTATNNRDEYLAIAPQSEMGFYVVPRVVE